jgi:hypothetical protein
LLNYIESARTHSAVGAFGGTITSATVGTLSTLSCAAAHNLLTGDQVQITGVGGTTSVNGLGYAFVWTPTTFSLFSDPAVTIPVPGVGTYTSGGQVSMAYDVSTWTNPDFTLRVYVHALTNPSQSSPFRALVSVQESVDGFVSDIRTLSTIDVAGPHAAGSAARVFTWRAYELPENRVGITNARLRLFVQALDSGTSATLSLEID